MDLSPADRAKPALVRTVQRISPKEETLTIFPADDGRGPPKQTQTSEYRKRTSQIVGGADCTTSDFPFRLAASPETSEHPRAREGGGTAVSTGTLCMQDKRVRSYLKLSGSSETLVKLTGAAAASPTSNVPVKVVLILRSVEGVFQFLGSYLRYLDDVAAADGEPSLYLVGGKPLFRTWSGAEEGRVIVGASLDGRRYFIRQSGSDEAQARPTLRALGLLQQLVNLQKKSIDRPATQAVQVVR